jgi:hypothetical protein
MWMKVTIPLAFLVLLAIGTEAQTRRIRLRARPVQQLESAEEETSDEVVQYYRPQPKQDNAQELVYVNEEEYQNLYGQSTPASRPRDYRPAVTTVRPLSRAQPQNLAPRTKEPESKAPPVQTIRNYNKVNDDGSFTFGYEAADGSFKEETRGTDCVVRGRYGYVDPEGNKREFTYVSGNPCDPNNPDSQEEEEPTRNRSEEDLDENVPQNYPKRPIAAVQRPRPTHAPTTARAPTTVFQNRYNHQSLASEEEEDDRQIQYAQIPKTSPRPAFVQSTPRPRVQQAQPSPPPTTYRPQTVSIVTPAPAHATTPSFAHKQQGVTFASGSTRGAIDFDAEFKKFQHDNAGGFQPITQSPSSQATKSVKIPSNGAPSSNPIYQTQLVYNPSSGQYDSNLYQSIAQTDGEFQLNQRIQPYVQQYQQPQYQIPQQQTVYRPPQQQQQVVPQQVYQRQQNEQQFANSQQLFAQQLQQQQSQLHRDRIEASKKIQSPAHRFQLQAEPSPILTGQLRAQNNQQFYYLQPQAQQSGGQIEAFLRGHNLEY